MKANLLLSLALSFVCFGISGCGYVPPDALAARDAQALARGQRYVYNRQNPNLVTRGWTDPKTGRPPGRSRSYPHTQNPGWRGGPPSGYGGPPAGRPPGGPPAGGHPGGGHSGGSHGH